MSLHLETVERELATEYNPYLDGVYAPTHEELTLEGLEVAGEIPDDLNGVYVRNGPNPQFDPRGRYHWFDGDGMVHALHLADGRASYRNRWIRTQAFEAERNAAAPLWTGIMEPVAGNPPGAPEKDTANTDVLFHRDRLLALWYRAGKPYALDPVTLETLGDEDFGGTLRCEVSAHAKVDERTGELMFFDYGFKRPYMRYGVVGPDGGVRHFTPIDLPGPRLPHDMAITQKHSILMDLPLVNDPEAARAGRFRLLFQGQMPSRFGVIPRYGSPESIRWFEAEPCFIYHSVNAWEDGNEVVMDVCRVKKPEPRSDLDGPLAQMLSYLRLDANLHRYRFNMHTGRTTEQPLDDDNSEFPSLNLGMVGERTRFAYAMHISPEKTLLFDGLMKYEVDSGEAETYWYGDGRWGSEAPFAPRPGSTDEDDGYLLSYVYDEREDRSDVEVLDARAVGDGPVCRIRLPVRVPLGFHATWVPGERLPGGSA
jgi:carotenoid cleavage dioxygenase-like enzyme